MKPEHQEAVTTLTRSWLEDAGLLEDADRPFLEDPMGVTASQNGKLLVALDDEQVVGVIAILRLDADWFELAKLAVLPAARRTGIGRRLVRAVLHCAALGGATTIKLTSNSRLIGALKLYEQLGFHYCPPSGPREYLTADTWMEIHLHPSQKKDIDQGSAD